VLICDCREKRFTCAFEETWKTKESCRNRFRSQRISTRGITLYLASSRNHFQGIFSIYGKIRETSLQSDCQPFQYSNYFKVLTHSMTGWQSSFIRSFSGVIGPGFQSSAGSNHQSVTVPCLSSFGFQTTFTGIPNSGSHGSTPRISLAIAVLQPLTMT